MLSKLGILVDVRRAIDTRGGLHIRNETVTHIYTNSNTHLYMQMHDTRSNYFALKNFPGIPFPLSISIQYYSSEDELTWGISLFLVNVCWSDSDLGTMTSVYWSSFDVVSSWAILFTVSTNDFTQALFDIALICGNFGVQPNANANPPPLSSTASGVGVLF